MFELTSRRLVAIAAFAILAGGVAAAIGTVAGHRDAEASAVVSLAPLTPEVSQYFLVPVTADFEAYMGTSSAAEVAAEASHKAPGVFRTMHQQDASDVTVTYRAVDPAAARTGLVAGVRAGFDHVIASQLRRSTLAGAAADRRVEAAKAALVDFQKTHGVGDAQAAQAAARDAVRRLEKEIAAGTAVPNAESLLQTRRSELATLVGLSVDQQILRTSLDQALSQRGDADAALSRVQGLSTALDDVAVVSQLEVVTASPLPNVLRAALLGLVSGAVIATAQLWIASGLRGRARTTTPAHEGAVLKKRRRQPGAVDQEPKPRPAGGRDRSRQVWPVRPDSRAEQR